MAYGTDEGAADWLASMGYALPVDAPPVAVLRARASAYLDAVYEPLWTGERTGGVMQEDGWPRTGALFRCKPGAIPDDAVPPAVVKAAYRAMWLEVSDPGILSASMTAGQRVAREKVDVIEMAYHDDGGKVGSGSVAFVDSEIDGAMRAFICDAPDGPGLGVWTVGR